MGENWISILLSSAVVSAITSGIITFIIEKRKYSQEYWKISIEKRLETYEMIEKILVYFQTSHIIDSKPCHLAFLDLEVFEKLTLEVAMISWKRIWISSDLHKNIIELNRLLYKLNCQNIDSKSISEFGILNYAEIANIRDEMIKIIAKDYLNMPNVEAFFKSKINETYSFVDI